MSSLDCCYRSHKQLPRPVLEKQDITGAELAQGAPQDSSVGSQEEELGPEAVRLLVDVIVLFPGRVDQPRHMAGGRDCVGGSAGDVDTFKTCN